MFKDKESAGTALIWLGVLAWLPFFVMISSGREVSVLPFLAAHLIGVLGGARLRSMAERVVASPEAAEDEATRRIKLISRVLIYLGVLAWAPYIYLTRIVGQELEVGPFLIAHLTGVLGGAALRASLAFRK
jgi:uncharacterized membrane protein